MNERFPRRLASLVALIALVLVAAGCAAPPYPAPSESAQPPPSRSTGGTVSTSLVERYLTYPGVPYEEIEILQGKLPGDLPADIPVPENSSIVGSIVRSGKYTAIEIVLDVPQQPEKVIGFYREHLTGDGWEEMEQPSPGGGFVSSAMLHYVNFCLKQEVSLNVMAYPTEEGRPSDVRLVLSDDPQRCRIYGEKAGAVYPGVYPGGAGEVLAPLLAPEGTVQRSGGGGSSNDRQYSMALMETSLTTDELQTHYQVQLLEAGWKLVEEGAGKTLTWSTWAFADDSDNDWSGLLLIRAPEEDYRILYLVADLIP